MSFSRGRTPSPRAASPRRWTRRACVAALVALILSFVVSATIAGEVATIDILLQDRAGVTGPHLAGALATADRLFRTAGVRLIWRQSPRETDLPQFTIVLSSERDTRLHAHLEDSHVGVFLRSSRRAYIMYDRVVFLGRHYQTDIAAMLGWAVAHEIGHLLLGDEHAASGVMAPRLTPAQFLEEPFSITERSSMLAGASARPVMPASFAATAPVQAADSVSLVDATH